MNIFSEIVKDIEGVPGDVVKLFTSPAAESAIKEIATLAIAAQPYVADVQALVGTNPVVSKVVAAYQKYAVPFSENLLTDTPAQRVTDTEDLVIALMQKNGVKATTIAHLQTAVGLAKAVVATATPAPTAAPEVRFDAEEFFGRRPNGVPAARIKP